MGAMIRSLRLAVLAVATSIGAAGGQDLRFFYPAPAESAFTVASDVEYGASLRMDVFRPAKGSSGTTHPTLIFFNVATGAQRSSPFYAAWGRIAAANGVTAILPDHRMESATEDFLVLHQYLATQKGSEHGIDGNAVALYAGSGNVSRALPLVQDRRSTVIKSAVMYYGTGQVSEFRLDLPMLYVRAGLDRPPVNSAIDRSVVTALTQNAPVTLLNYASGYHAFEIRNDDEQTRRVIDQTIDFVKTTTSAGYQAALRRGVLEATAAGLIASGKYGEGAKSYAQLVSAAPDNHTLRLAYGEALLADRQFAAACAEFAKLKGKGLGPRDLGVPAARACMQKGDAGAAMAWLQSIPPRFRPLELAKDPIFAPIQDRAEFKALFESR
jgi:hypothetical protein